MVVSVLLLVLLSVAALSVPVAQAQTTTTAPTTTSAPTTLPGDCNDVFMSTSTHSGLYTIYPKEHKPVKVYCHMDCEDDKNKAGWTVIQRRMDGTENFYRPWSHYKEGFGNISGEHWLGLDDILAITWEKKYMLRVEMEDFEGGRVHACYSDFSIAPESDGYKLYIGKYIDGGAGNALASSNGRRFSTFDKDQDGSYYVNFAERYHGGFWFGHYLNANPNGLYKWGRHSGAREGVWWGYWKGYYYSLKTISMKIRPASREKPRPFARPTPGYPITYSTYYRYG